MEHLSKSFDSFTLSNDDDEKIDSDFKVEDYMNETDEKNKQ